jgi:hypothetical protein
MNIFKKINLFFTYRSSIISIQKELELEYNARIDNIYRIYTVVNLPDILFEEPYNTRTSDIDSISRRYILEFRQNFSDFLVKKGLLELFDIYEVRKVDKYSYLLIFGFSLFNTKKTANRIFIFSILLTLISIITLSTYLILKL